MLQCTSSLETRAPFLNHRIIEFTSKLPDKLLIHNGKGKVLLREALNKFIPKKVFDRPKQGFGIPIGEWLKSDLRSGQNTYYQAVFVMSMAYLIKI